MNAPDTAAPAGNPARKRALLTLTALLALAGLAAGVYWLLALQHVETTDNAYVQGNVVQITPQQGGTVVAINADDTDRVQAGQVLVQLDPADAQVALAQAEAQLAQTVREVRTLYASNGALQAQVALRQADLGRAHHEQARAQDDVTRRAPLLASGAVGQEEFKHLESQLAAARSSVAAAAAATLAAQEQLGANRTLTDGVGLDQHPGVLRAAAHVREAHLALQRATLLAPVAGFVAKRSVQLGQRVAAGAPLLSVIALDQLWVEANFKEGQLRQLRLGQPVTLTSDLYGRGVAFHGRVAGLGAGTGAAFALLPAQNATGNWIKVVQRVPVRIRLDAQELLEHPLRIGLSMEARVDISRTEGLSLAQAGPATATATVTTRVFEAEAAVADAAVRRIIAANGGRSGGGATAAAR